MVALGRQTAARGPNVARHSVFSGSQKHSGKSSNLLFPPVSRININAEVINQDLLLLTYKGATLRQARPSQSGHQAKITVHP